MIFKADIEHGFDSFICIDKGVAVLFPLGSFPSCLWFDPKIYLASIDEFFVIFMPVTFVMMHGPPLSCGKPRSVNPCFFLYQDFLFSIDLCNKHESYE
jgi:hypothetical protein